MNMDNKDFDGPEKVIYEPGKWCSAADRGDTYDNITLLCRDSDLCNLKWSKIIDRCENETSTTSFKVRI